MEEKYKELSIKYETIEGELAKERDEKSLMFLQIQTIEGEYTKIKGKNKSQPKGAKSDILLNKILVSVRMQQQDEPKEKEFKLNDMKSESSTK